MMVCVIYSMLYVIWSHCNGGHSCLLHSTITLALGGSVTGDLDKDTLRRDHEDIRCLDVSTM